MKKLKIAALALFIGCAFGFLMPVQVWAVDYPGGPTSTSELAADPYRACEDDYLRITGDTILNIDFDLTVDYIVVENGCNLTITGESGKTLTCIKDMRSGHAQDSLTIKSGTIICGDDQNLGGIRAFKNLTIEDGNVTVNGGQLYVWNDLVISGGTITVNTTDNTDAIDAYGTTFEGAGNLKISGGTVNAQATGTGNGIHAKENITISGGTVNAQATGTGNGIEAGKKITISGSDTVVKAKCKEPHRAVKAFEENGLSIAKPLMVTKPAGGGLSYDKQYIATHAGGEDGAVDVVIEKGSPEKGSPEEPGTVASSEKAFGRYDRKDSDDSVEEYTKSAPINKDALVITKMSGFPPGTFFAKQEQGIAAKNAFMGALPAGYKSAFTFNVITNGKTPDISLKKGSFTLLIPEEFRKPGRTFAILALDKSGKAILLTDTDTDPTTITVSLNLEGYAFDLIYKD